MLFLVIATLGLMVAPVTANAAPTAVRSAELSLADCNQAAPWRTLQASSEPQRSVPARAIWLDGQHIFWPGATSTSSYKLWHAARPTLIQGADDHINGADESLTLEPSAVTPTTLPAQFAHMGAGVVLTVPSELRDHASAWLRGQLWLTRQDLPGTSPEVTRIQAALALDDLYGEAAARLHYGVQLDRHATQFRLWAPTAQGVGVCLHAAPDAPATRIVALQRDDASGAWSASVPERLDGHMYRYLVDVVVPGVGLVRNRVTDPYSVSLSADSQFSAVLDLQDPRLMPAGWSHWPQHPRVRTATDLMIYELHVRDFSATDSSVPAAHRGKYLAFTDRNARGMRHLRALAQAGMTDVHLLPVFDFATVPERNCVTPHPERLHAGADSEQQQALVMATAQSDCFNWGYDPWHFNAPDGSYASDAENPRVRVLEFRRMVQALHRTGLRVGMDVVYNHMSASGQHDQSVLDRIVPGYYHRLNAQGEVERSTCCDNTATEHRMMAKLMQDSVVLWATQYHIDSFRFDLMGHQPRAAMVSLQAALKQATGRTIHLIGEGWNFGEVADGRRFVQAAQGRLDATSIGTFSDRGRDALRGGGAGDGGGDLVARQGYINGLFYAPNESGSQATRAELLATADLVRVGLAGTLRDLRMINAQDQDVPLTSIRYHGEAAGYASQPSEVVNYVENHDNHTLFDANVYKLPLETTRNDRVRVQMLGSAVVALSQGIAYFHAGQDILRSKSMDGNSFDSGDWFNQVDWSYSDNHFGAGAPPRRDNEGNYPWIKPRLIQAAIRPTPADIRASRDMFQDLLRVRASTTLLRLRSADDIRQRLRFLNTGSTQEPTVLAVHLDGVGYPSARFQEMLALINVDVQAHRLTFASERGKPYRLHPVQRSRTAADSRPRRQARYRPGDGGFLVPPRSAVVYVVE